MDAKTHVIDAMSDEAQGRGSGDLLSGLDRELKKYGVDGAGCANIRRMVCTDGLTGLQNKQFYNEVIYRNMKAEEAKGGVPPHALIVAAIDIDFFKSVNDTYGHDVGDAVLRTFGRLLRKHTDAASLQTDSQHSFQGRVEAIRNGGEEFLVCVPVYRARMYEGIRSIYQMLYGFRQDLEKTTFKAEAPNGQKVEFQVTFSAGIGLGPETKGRADAALYAAKEVGRNVMTFALPPDENAVQYFEKVYMANEDPRPQAKHHWRRKAPDVRPKADELETSGASTPGAQSGPTPGPKSQPAETVASDRRTRIVPGDIASAAARRAAREKQAGL